MSADCSKRGKRGTRARAMDMSSTLFANASTRLVLEHEGTHRLLHVIVEEREYVNTADSMALLSAIQAFYNMNNDRFAQLIEINTQYPPSVNVIMASVGLMRESHEYFKTHLICTGVVLGEHAVTVQKYMRAYVPTRPIHYIKDAATFRALLLE